MKTTIEIADGLFRQAKQHAARRGITLRQLVEEGLRITIDEPRPREKRKLRDASVAGDGLQPGVSWDRMHEHAYEDSPSWLQLTPTSSSTPTAARRRKATRRANG